MKSLIIAAGLALGGHLLSGCEAPSVRANVESFSAIESSFRGETIAVAPYDEQQDSLEFARHAKKLEAKLTAAGMKVVPYNTTEAPPRFVAFLDFSIDGGREVPYSYSMPTWGPTGVTSSQTTGSLTGYGTYSGTTTYQQSYGITGYNTVSGTDTRYTRLLYLDIMEIKPDGKIDKAYEARLTSSGSCGNLSAIMDSLLIAVFHDFPKEASGEVIAPPPENC